MAEPVRFTPEELKSLFDQRVLQPEDIRAMHPADRKVLLGMAAELEKTGDTTGGLRQGSLTEGISKHPIAAAGFGAAAAAPMIAGGVPAAIGSVLGAPSGVGGALKAGVGGYLGWEGAQAIGQALGLPSPIRNILGMAGAHMGGGFGKKGGPIESPSAPATEAAGLPELFPSRPKPVQLERPTIGGPGPRLRGGVSDADMLEQVSKGVTNDFKGTVSFRKPASEPSKGRPGQGLSPGEEAGVQDLEELFSRTGNSSPNPMGHGTYKDGGSGHLGGPDTAGLRSQPNVNLRRTTADTREQVMRGVGGDNSYQDPRSISVEYGNTPENTRSVEAIQAELKKLLDARLGKKK